MRAFFADSECRNVCESPITQDHGISRDLYWVASGLQVEIPIDHSGAPPFVFSLDPLEVMNFYYLFLLPHKLARSMDES